MIDFDLYLLFIGSCLILGLIPGPNIALIVANSIAHGTRYGLASVAGTSSAMIPQLTITVLGATTLLVLISSAFVWLKWIGVIYLLYLGLQHWFAKDENSLDVTADQKADTYRKVFWRGFWVSSTNPKTLLFFGAFFPQFVSSQESIISQMIVLSVTFIVVVSFVDSCWAFLAGQARPFLAKFSRLRHRVSGAFFITAGVGLALAKKP